MARGVIGGMAMGTLVTPKAPENEERAPAGAIVLVVDGAIRAKGNGQG